MNRILLTTLTVCLLVAFAANTNAQETKKVISYSKSIGDSRIMVLRSDNTLW